jgi:hypothetical protein
VVQDSRHRSLLQFIRRIVDVPLGYTKDDLLAFRNVALRAYPSLVDVIDAYIKISDVSDTDVPEPSSNRARQKRSDTEAAHLFDMLREKKFFPMNSDLSDFAGKVLPSLSRHRFDKMSRAEISGKIIEYLETLPPRTRQALEASMRDALRASPSRTTTDRKSFVSKWEKIIKGIEL